MKVQEYLKENGLQKLHDELKIEVREYPDRVVLNYSQIDSPRFHPVCDECRGLILRKDTWEVLARSFNRFYNVGESPNSETFQISKSRIEEKVDGSLMSCYFDGQEWCVASRSMAYAEGTVPIGLTFRQIFDKAAFTTSLWVTLNVSPFAKIITWVFELTSPENRVVTPYSEASLTLIGGRNNHNGNELTGAQLDSIAKVMRVRRPRSYQFSTLKDTVAFVKTLTAMEEGFVMTYEDPNGFSRLKCKNEKYLAIAHLRENGGLSAKRVLTLVVMNEVAEYLSYFPEDKPYFDFVGNIWKAITDNVATLHNQYGKLESQKEFALAIMPLVKNSWEKGVLFEMRKKKISLAEVIKNMNALDCRRLAKDINLRGKLSKQFGIIVEEDA